MSTAYLITSVGQVPLASLREDTWVLGRFTATVDLRTELGRRLLDALLAGDLWSCASLISVWPNAYVSRTHTGAWRVRGCGPSKRYRSKRLAQTAADRRSHRQSQNIPVHLERYEVSGRDVLHLTLRDTEWRPLATYSHDGMVPR